MPNKKRTHSRTDARTPAPDAHTRTPANAAALIASAKAKAIKHAAPNATALAELRTICEYNDTAPRYALRVGADDAIAMLRAHGWLGVGRHALDSLCRTSLGRRTYACA